MDINEIKEKIMATTNVDVIKDLISKVDLSKLDVNTLTHIQSVVGDIPGLKDLLSEDVMKNAESLLGQAKGLFGK